MLRARHSAGATIAACRAALAEGAAVNLGGGTHHAHPDHGQGYCLLNDAAVAVRAVQAEARAARVLIVDCDVHQGNGTAAIFSGDPRVFTFSIHGANNFPLRKEPSDLDVALPDGTGDAEYMKALRAVLVVRSNYAAWTRSDHTGFEVMLGDMATFSPPEETAERARVFWC